MTHKVKKIDQSKLILKITWSYVMRIFKNKNELDKGMLYFDKMLFLIFSMVGYFKLASEQNITEHKRNSNEAKNVFEEWLASFGVSEKSYCHGSGEGLNRN